MRCSEICWGLLCLFADWQLPVSLSPKEEKKIQQKAALLPKFIPEKQQVMLHFQIFNCNILQCSGHASAFRL